VGAKTQDILTRLRQKRKRQTDYSQKGWALGGNSHEQVPKKEKETENLEKVKANPTPLDKKHRFPDQEFGRQFGFGGQNPSPREKDCGRPVRGLATRLPVGVQGDPIGGGRPN